MDYFRAYSVVSVNYVFSEA